jgi:hypothetical protein
MVFQQIFFADDRTFNTSLTSGSDPVKITDPAKGPDPRSNT